MVSIFKRCGGTLAGILSLAVCSLVLLCGAGSVPVENFLPQGTMQGDLNAGAHNLTNAATVYATSVVVSGGLTVPSSFTLPYSKLSGAPTLGPLAAVSPGGTAGTTTFLKYDGTNFAYATPLGGGGTGTVTSVGLTAPSFETVSGSPVTGSGTLTLGLATQTASAVFAGPVSGGSAAPTFRALAAGDIPLTLNGGMTIGSTSTAYQAGNSLIVLYSDSNTTASPGGTTMSVTSDWVPGASASGVQKISVSDAVFAGGSNNAGNIVVQRSTGTDRGTGNVSSITGFDTHLGNQSHSLGGGSGTVSGITSFLANSPETDALDTVGTATGLDIAAQKTTGVTNGIAINQEGVNDQNIYNGLNVYGNGSNFSFGTSTGTKIGLGANQLLAFYGSTPIVQPSGDILMALGAASLGLIANPTIGGNDVNPAVTTGTGTVSNTTTVSFITNGGTVKGSAAIVANKLVVGSTYRLRMMGTYSTTGTPTLALTWGTYVSGLGTTLATTGAQTMPSGASNLEWCAEYTFTVESTGSAGTAIGQGWAEVQTGAGTSVRYPMPNTSTVTINTTTSNWLMGFVTWGTAAVGNTITCTNATVEQIY